MWEFHYIYSGSIAVLCWQYPALGLIVLAGDLQEVDGDQFQSLLLNAMPDRAHQRVDKQFGIIIVKIKFKFNTYIYMFIFIMAICRDNPHEPLLRTSRSSPLYRCFVVRHWSRMRLIILIVGCYVIHEKNILIYQINPSNWEVI